MPSKWMDWKPTSDTFETPYIGENPIIHASEGRNDGREPRIIEKTPIPPVSKVSEVPPMPEGVHLVRWEPKAAPVGIDVCSVVVDVPKFIETELRDLNSRLNFPWTIRGGFTIPQILDRLKQAGVEVEVHLQGEKP